MKPITLGMQKLISAERKSLDYSKKLHSKKQKSRKTVDNCPNFCDTIERVQRKKLWAQMGDALSV